MQIFQTSAFLGIIILCSLTNNVAVVTVKYSREPVMETEGRSVSLKCTVKYRTQDCDIDSKWWYLTKSDPVAISDPKRYLVTVNETEIDEERHRNIFLTFRSLSFSDIGYYQCDAKCLNTGTAAKGHVVPLNVTADPYKGLKVSTSSGQLKTDAAALTLSAMLFLWRY